MAQYSTPITTANSAAEGRLREGINSKRMRIKSKKSGMLKNAINKSKADGRGGEGSLKKALKNIIQNSVSGAKNSAKSVSNIVQTIGKSYPNPVGALKRRVRKAIDDKIKETNEWSEKRYSKYRNAWRSNIPGKKNVDANGIVHYDESAY